MRSLGKYFIFMGSLFTRRETFSTYIRLITQECINVGYNSLFIVGIVSVFMGAVTTIQTAFNLVSPFIPDYVPAVGEVDACLKMNKPDGTKEDLGITQLDEPALNCEDKTVLELKYV